MGLAKKIAIGVGVFVGVLGLGVGGFVYSQVSAYDASMAKTYDLPSPAIVAATDADSIVRGRHLTQALAGCALRDCHGGDMAGGNPVDAGPLGTFTAPNITHLLKAYSDGELARLIRHGIKKNGQSVAMMPVQDFAWLSDADVASLIGYLRTVPESSKASGVTTIRTLGKILDRQGKMPLDIARFMSTLPSPGTPPPAARTKEYGRFVARLCMGCHGEGYSGGPLPGAPPDFPIPANLTPHESGMKGYTYDDFVKLSQTGLTPKGKKLHQFMPIEALASMNDDERGALFDYLQSLPPKPFGGR